MSSPGQPSRAALWLLGVIYLAFISLGLPDGTLGVAWPAIYPELGLPVGLAGIVIFLGTVLTATAGFSSGRVVARFGTAPVLIASVVLTSGGLFLLSQAKSAAWLFAAAVPLGFGAGAVDAALNGYVARHYAGRHMNWLHACWGIGATAGPLVVAEAMASSHGWRGAYLWLGGVQAALAVLFFATRSWWRRVPELPPTRNPEAKLTRAPVRGANSPEGWVSAAAFLLYTGAEMSLGLWAATILVVQRGLTPELAGLWAAGYYAAITIGRIAIGFGVERLGNRRAIRGGVLLALTGLLAFAFGGGGWVAAVGLALTGLGFAPIYPGLMHEVPRRFAGEAVQTVIGRQSGAGALGAAFVPAAAGALAQSHLGGIVWLAFAVLLGLLAAVLWLEHRCRD
jgi:fucose permease